MNQNQVYRHLKGRDFHDSIFLCDFRYTKDRINNATHDVTDNNYNNLLNKISKEIYSVIVHMMSKGKVQMVIFKV